MSRIIDYSKGVTARLLEPFIPERIKQRVKSRFFQPAKDPGILDRIARKAINEHYHTLSETEKINFAQHSWQGLAGCDWIETKRDGYHRGEMNYFAHNVRTPFLEMVSSFLEKNREYKFILEIGTGCGQLVFRLFEQLDSDYQLIGIDLNSQTIERNIEEARHLGLSENIHFECAEAGSWLSSRNNGENILVLSLGVLKYFTQDQLRGFLALLRERYNKPTLALCEDVFCNFSKHRDSQYTGSLGFSHNYPLVLQELGFNIKQQRLMQFDRETAEIGHFYCLAAF